MQYSAVAHTVLAGANQLFENLQAGESHVCVSSPVYCWGDNTYSQITDLVELGRTEVHGPPLLPELANMRHLTLGVRHTCANDGDRTLCWGLDDFRQCGGQADFLCSPDAPCAKKPLEVRGISGALGLGLGLSHSCAIKADRTVKCWGASDKGQAGALPSADCGTEGCVVEATDIANLSGVTRLALGTSHSCALTVDGSVYCWGDNDAGQLGINSQGGSFPAPVVPVRTMAGGAIRDVLDIAASDTQSCALTTEKLYCWGLSKTQLVLSAATEIPLDR